MKPPRVFVEPAENRAPTRRVVARGSEPQIGKPQHVTTNTIIVDVSTPANTKPTRQVQHAPEIESISMARREAHRTRRMQTFDDVAADQTRTGEIPLCDWTTRPPMIVAPPASTSTQAAAKRDYRRGLVMGAAIATVIATSLAATVALLV